MGCVAPVKKNNKKININSSATYANLITIIWNGLTLEELRIISTTFKVSFPSVQ
jgi:hypothetical protein